jgi:hypothetical protein
MFKLPANFGDSPGDFPPPHWELVTTLLRYAELTEEARDFLRDLKRESFPLSWEQITILEVIVWKFVRDNQRRTKRLLTGQRKRSG